MRLVPWLLCALLLAAQQWALWHPLQHLQAGAATAHAGHPFDEGPAAAAECHECLALAALSGALPVAAASLAWRAPPMATAAGPLDLAPARPGRWSRHNRGPPVAG